MYVKLMYQHGFDQGDIDKESVPLDIFKIVFSEHPDFRNTVSPEVPNNKSRRFW